MPAGRGRAAGPGRGTARTGMGRSGRPVHHHREDHHRPAPVQARRPAGDPDRPGKRLPHRRTLMRTPRPHRLRLPRRTARLRLTILYGAAFVVCGACGAALLAVTYLLYGHLTPRLTTNLTTHLHGHTTHRTHTVPQATRQAGMTIHVAGLGQITLDRQQLLIASAIALAVFVVAAAALGWLMAGRVLRRLSTITVAARRISASSLHERLALHGPDDELKELGDTLDNLFTRLEASFEAQRRFAASASHELRTPLTRERTLLQVTLADPAA